ncbi:metalloregulator ArsR/SmtB family transcription factor [Massilia sp. W12]|uniref:ArsR/SmtB family transcription factor n=1 Tax=Massilia sp. W12 TaxID=3126507 RepID=UPI0030CC8686
MSDSISLSATLRSQSSSAVPALLALAHEVRLSIFRLLVVAGPEGMPASKLAELLAMPASSLSFHLKELSHAQLLHSKTQGRFVIYSANFAKMQELIAFLLDNCCQGASCDPAAALEAANPLCCGPATSVHSGEAI